MLKEREYLAFSLFLCILFRDAGCDPLVVNTWAFTDATSAAWQVIESGGSGSEAVVRGCSVCEREQCDGTVGYGGSPDENGETTLDAMIMDGNTADAASVAGLREIKDAIAVARAVMQHTKHTLLVGSLATDFAVVMGFNRTDLHTNSSVQKYEEWKARNCQPNFWMNVTPDPSVSCGPYQPDSANSAASRQKRKHNNTRLRKSKKRSNVVESNSIEKKRGTVNMRYDSHVDNHHHDTIGMIALDGDGGVTVGTSTNGANHKIPGRVGDSPIIGAGGYADSEVGGAVATGDGDVMMRFLPTFLAVELMRQGKSPDEACETAISRIVRHYPAFNGAVVAATKDGHVGAACHGFQTFPFSMASATTQGVEVLQVTCLK